MLWILCPALTADFSFKALDVRVDELPSNSFIVLEDNLPTRQLSSILQCNAIAFFLNEKMARVVFRDMVAGNKAHTTQLWAQMVLLYSGAWLISCTAVIYLHSCGCVHRRLRETSFALTDDGFVKLVEFGCSGIPSADSDARLNLFRPPEFSEPAAATQASLDIKAQAKADVWSLGVLLVIMTTGGQRCGVFVCVCYVLVTPSLMHPSKCMRRAVRLLFSIPPFYFLPFSVPAQPC